ncbi:hypothetical protein [Zestomonas thermotolerans]|uniref:hypothetical protein n=1 Tax=Zestomonas thermotolerans TaxID=157784 RepID=UPI000480ACF7|nr:hypothetical protein [Pseudomonas thermotolerans]
MSPPSRQLFSRQSAASPTGRYALPTLPTIHLARRTGPDPRAGLGLRLREVRWPLSVLVSVVAE